MRISELIDARVGLLGLGVEGRSTLAALRRAGHEQDVAIFLDKPGTEALPAGARFADDPERAFAATDVLVRSPGFAPEHPLRRLADARGVAQTTATNLFLCELRARDLPSVGVTGSKGKSTTSTIIFRALERGGIESSLVGNIGAPALDVLDDVIARRAVPVVELSSYQCADLVAAPSIAVLLELFPEHMDWHGSIDAYYRAKMQLALRQRPEDRFFYLVRNRAYVEGFELPGKVEAVGTEDGVHHRDRAFWNGRSRLFADDCVHIPGDHNKRNVCCAIAAVIAAGASPTSVESALGDFNGLPYRLQDEGYRGGIRWINDSISTAPEAAVAALGAFGASVRTLIFGGFDRGYELGIVLEALGESNVECVVALPTTGHRLARELLARHAAPRVVEVASLDEAVAAASRATPQGGLCLFSPGAPSYGFFRNFEERGHAFATLVAALERSELSPAR
ncbi:MAG TPA: UDP-N-acetylmuramoyl-L-alanine--D-glutamate ligase [Polyangiaceae bacterium]|nr:UDP-N-acetylmuramoyl-L-alanine--D-glutamate ligase [Polyangiaceae bacterium]